MDAAISFLTHLAVTLCQFLAIFVITVGIAKALWIYLKDALYGTRSLEAIRESRMELGHAFSLGLGFLIGASILKTAVAPNWTDIGQLAAIIVIRTGLNYFLLKDISMHSEDLLARSVRGDVKGAVKPGLNEEDDDVI